MGTPQFAVPTLELLSQTRYKPVLVITQPDKPKGRKKKLLPTEVKAKAIELGIEVFQPENINNQEILKKIESYNSDLIITVAYGGYLGRQIRKMPSYGCINLHPSLLPKYRGSCPMNYSLFNGDKTTGITIFKIVAKMDAGPILYQNKISIEENESYTHLYNRLSKTGAEDILKVIKNIESGNFLLTKQEHEKASFTIKLEKKDFEINWNASAYEIHNKIRGLSEVPGAKTSINNKLLKIIESKIINEKVDKNSITGEIIEIIKNVGIKISTKDKFLLITKVQPAGKKIMSAYAFNLGARLKKGDVFGVK